MEDKIRNLERVISFQDSFIMNKEFNRIMLGLPESNSKNPIATLANFCNHYLGNVKVTYKFSQEATEVFFDNQPVLRKLKEENEKEKETAAIETLKRLNEDRLFLFSWIHLALTKKK